MRARLPVVVALIVVVTACDAGPGLFVELKTDMVSGVEFARVDTAIIDAPRPGSPVIARPRAARDAARGWRIVAE